MARLRSSGIVIAISLAVSPVLGSLLSDVGSHGAQHRVGKIKSAKKWMEVFR